MSSIGSVRLFGSVTNCVQSSLVAPTPLARLSFSSPFVTERLIGASARERLIPKAWTPSQLFVPWVSETRWRVAPALPLPCPVAAEVSRVSAIACAPAAPSCPPLAAFVTVPTSSDPVPVAVKRPASAIVAVPEMWRLCAAVTSIVWRSIPV